MALQIRSPAGQIKTLQLTNASAAAVSKVPVVVNGHVLIPMHDAAINTAAGYCYEAEISDAPKVAGTAIGALDDVYWDASAGNVTTSSSGNTLIGYALEACDAADTTTGLIAYNAFAA